MARSYRHIKEYEKEIYELKEKGLTNREIANKFGFELEQVKGLIKRHNRNQRKIAAGIASSSSLYTVFKDLSSGKSIFSLLSQRVVSSDSVCCFFNVSAYGFLTAFEKSYSS